MCTCLVFHSDFANAETSGCWGRALRTTCRTDLSLPRTVASAPWRAAATATSVSSPTTYDIQHACQDDNRCTPATGADRMFWGTGDCQLEFLSCETCKAFWAPKVRHQPTPLRCPFLRLCNTRQHSPSSSPTPFVVNQLRWIDVNGVCRRAIRRRSSTRSPRQTS